MVGTGNLEKNIPRLGGHQTRAQIHFVFYVDKRGVADVIVEALEDLVCYSFATSILHVILLLHLALIVLIEDVRVQN